MVKKVVWSKKSLVDLQVIYEYISKDSLYYAELTVNQIILKAAQIQRSPLAGKIVPEFADTNLRELFYKNFRIIYRLADSTAYVVRIFHSSRLLKSL